MKSIKMAAIVALLAGSMAIGASQITFTLEAGGDNSSALWEDNGTPTFQSGVTTNGTTVAQGDDLTWAVRVTVSGTHEGGAGDSQAPLGAANLVFDLLVLDDTDTPVAFGAAPIACTTGNPGESTATVCEPTAAGFHSTINDGDADGNRGFGGNADLYANGSFAIKLGAGADKRLVDANPGPNFDYGWYPTADGKGGIPTSGGTPATTTTATGGELLGFGAGYKDYDFGTNYVAGVGVDGPLGFWGSGECGEGFGSDLPLFEGQISTIGLTPGIYKIVLIPGAHGNNILQGSIDCIYSDFGGFGSFANEANGTAVSNVDSAITFEVVGSNPEVVGRHVFYDASWYDAPSVGPYGCDAQINGGLPCDDDSAIDSSKSAGLPGEASSWDNAIAYTKGINGVMIDIADLTVTPTAADFEFEVGNPGAIPNIPFAAWTPSSLTVTARPGEGVSGSTRVTLFFADNDVPNKSWLKVIAKTSLGLAADDVHYWGLSFGNSGLGDTATKAFVNATDQNAVRSNPHGFINPAPVDDFVDFNKDRFVNATDQNTVRSNPAGFLDALNYITFP